MANTLIFENLQISDIFDKLLNDAEYNSLLATSEIIKADKKVSNLLVKNLSNNRYMAYMANIDVANDDYLKHMYAVKVRTQKQDLANNGYFPVPLEKRTKVWNNDFQYLYKKSKKHLNYFNEFFDIVKQEKIVISGVSLMNLLFTMEDLESIKNMKTFMGFDTFDKISDDFADLFIKVDETKKTTEKTAEPKPEIAEPKSEPAKMSINKMDLITKAMKSQILGQDYAIDKVMSRVKELNAKIIDLDYPKKPVMPIMLAGESGIGKTEIGEKLSRVMYNKPACVLNMSEYSEEISVSKLFGGSPNYVGYGDKMQFMSYLDANNSGVIVFDEIEKANPKVIQALLNVIDKGVFTSGHGDNYELRNYIILFTTNLGASNLNTPKLGFGKDALGAEEKNKSREQTIMDAFKDNSKFSNEFMKRLELVVCNKLETDTVRKITQLKIDKAVNELESASDFGLKVEVGSDVRNKIEDIIINDNVGDVRTIGRVVKQNVINPSLDILIEQKKPTKIELNLNDLGVAIKELTLNASELQEIATKLRKKVELAQKKAQLPEEIANKL